MPSVLRFPANQEKDPNDLPDTGGRVHAAAGAPRRPAEPAEEPPAIRRSSATIVPEASFDEPTRPSEHPTPI
jgi:hypothetical protein